MPARQPNGDPSTQTLERTTPFADPEQPGVVGRCNSCDRLTLPTGKWGYCAECDALQRGAKEERLEQTLEFARIGHRMALQAGWDPGELLERIPQDSPFDFPSGAGQA